MRVLLLSAYEAVSHRYWADQLMVRLDDMSWTRLSLAPRHFAWRIRGNPLSWWLKEQAALSEPYDVVLATSTVDLATLLGLFPHLSRARKIVYFHENQFAYPPSSAQQHHVEAKMVNLYAALAADKVVFNTAYNRDSFIDGARTFLKKMPENLPAAHPLETLRRQAMVLPVPLRPLDSPAVTANPRPARVIWNHRWEYDKNPEDFFDVLFRLSEAGVAFELAVVGQRFRDEPAIFSEARTRLAAHVVCWGPLALAEYQALLDEGGIVVSTTWHEFQGLAIMEAAQRGALPLVPERLCFPALYPRPYRYDGTPSGLYQRLSEWLTVPDSQPPVLGTKDWEWPQWEAAYQALLSE
ncbi:tRNA-queuosine alpha-mannosyltransferase domain-containing protein [Vreelandella sp. EE22]